MEPPEAYNVGFFHLPSEIIQYIIEHLLFPDYRWSDLRVLTDEDLKSAKETEDEAKSPQNIKKIGPTSRQRLVFAQAVFFKHVRLFVNLSLTSKQFSPYLSHVMLRRAIYRIWYASPLPKLWTPDELDTTARVPLHIVRNYYAIPPYPDEGEEEQESSVVAPGWYLRFMCDTLVNHYLILVSYTAWRNSLRPMPPAWLKDLKGVPIPGHQTQESARYAFSHSYPALMSLKQSSAEKHNIDRLDREGFFAPGVMTILRQDQWWLEICDSLDKLNQIKFPGSHLLYAPISSPLYLSISKNVSWLRPLLRTITKAFTGCSVIRIPAIRWYHHLQANWKYKLHRLDSYQEEASDPKNRAGIFVFTRNNSGSLSRQFPRRRYLLFNHPVDSFDLYRSLSGVPQSTIDAWYKEGGFSQLIVFGMMKQRYESDLMLQNIHVVNLKNLNFAIQALFAYSRPHEAYTDMFGDAYTPDRMRLLCRSVTVYPQPSYFKKYDTSVEFRFRIDEPLTMTEGQEIYFRDKEEEVVWIYSVRGGRFPPGHKRVFVAEKLRTVVMWTDPITHKDRVTAVGEGIVSQTGSPNLIP